MSEHIISVRSYVLVFLALLCLTGLTVGVAFVDLGSMNASDCAGDRRDENCMVMLIFMHVKYGSHD